MLFKYIYWQNDVKTIFMFCMSLSKGFTIVTVVSHVLCVSLHSIFVIYYNYSQNCWFQLGHTQKICVFPIAWSSKLGSVGRDVFLFFFETYKYAPSSKITQTCFFLSYYSLLIIWHAVQCFCYHLCVFFILYFYTWIIMMHL